MSKIGSFIFIIGVLAIVLDFIGRVPKVLFWIYSWGETSAWIIKIALVVVGARIFLLSNKGEVSEELKEKS
jgi:hypothetical protein